MKGKKLHIALLCFFPFTAWEYLGRSGRNATGDREEEKIA